MKKVKSDMEDELRPEYDLKSLRVRKLGLGRETLAKQLSAWSRMLLSCFPLLMRLTRLCDF